MTRSHALPENTRYADTGCYLHPACLTCPEPVCVLDLQKPGQTPTSRHLNYLVYVLYHNGIRPAAIARHLHISLRTVFRRLAAARSSLDPHP